MIGIGITIACLGLLGLLLGWAQHMRSAPSSLWFTLGAVLAVAGILIIAVGGARKRRR